jgi:ABC-type transporter MlaC component
MSFVKRSRFLIALAALLLFAPVCANTALAAPDVAKAEQFVLDGVARVSRILRSHNEPRERIAEKLRAEFRRGFDVPAIANFALGPARAKLSPEQKRQYVAEFEELIVQTYTSRVIHYGPRVTTDINDIIRFTGATPINDEQVMLHSRVNRKGADWVAIDWRIRNAKGRLAIVDITILGISQAMLYKSEIGAVVQQNGRGPDGLVDALRTKNAEIRNGK